ncbi:LysR substrate-binding domain-containing protein [Rhizobium sp. Root1220]|uniref:LysR substrate-binding domain-containing protein n=1 Tax=Rhizobium sp. Root1220 TaxID=1736432 RepID=UPI0006FF9284|nr:LysR substrate-binding domain-containing protein [Rhizobium sp. Root1220]KQV68276.1 transcriptional regulator [Rhizobium sp. Root1220]
MRLPPLKAIRAFEAVSRHGSILGAAGELGVVRGAVRQQIAILEAHFGEKLFEHDGRRLVATAKATKFARAATSAFAILHRASMEFEAGGHDRIRLGVPSAFAIWWLMPRLANMQATLGDVEVDIVPMTVVEPLSLRPEFDAVIMGGEYRPADGITAVKFMEDEFGPVATPDLAATIAGDPLRMADVTALISRSAPSLWSEWFSESGTVPVTFRRKQEFEDLLLALGAARSGLGVALAPRASIEDDLQRNILVAPYGFIRRPAGYSLSCRTADAKRPSFMALRDWLLGSAN